VSSFGVKHWTKLQQAHEDERHRCEVDWCVKQGAIWWHKWQTVGKTLEQARGKEAADKLIAAVRERGNSERNKICEPKA
jgi:hypothetical protein